MSFIDLDLKHTYNFSRGDKVLEDFYIPALKKSIKYDRATGYFSSASLVAAAAGMAQFVKNGGKYRLIFGREVPNEKDFPLAKRERLVERYCCLAVVES